MANPKLTVDDFTNQPQAMTAEDVNNQDARTRLWQSLNYSYGQQRKQSDEQYAKAQAQSWQQAFARGMQRSSYASAVAANLAKQGIDANNNIYAAQIADYQNRLGQLEQQEKEDERWERQFAADREDSAWNKEFQTDQFKYQKSRDAVGDQQWEKQFNEGVRQFDLQYALQNAAASGGGGAGGTGGYTGDPNAGYTPPPGLSNGDQELAAADAAMALFEKGKQIQAAPAKQMQIDQYQRQINALTKRLGTVKTVSERNEITNQIGVLNQKIRDMR